MKAGVKQTDSFSNAEDVEDINLETVQKFVQSTFVLNFHIWPLLYLVLEQLTLILRSKSFFDHRYVQIAVESVHVVVDISCWNVIMVRVENIEFVRIQIDEFAVSLEDRWEVTEV